MKKGIEAWTDSDAVGNWMLCIKKQKGKLTLDEIIEVCTECENDFYGLILKCFDGNGDQYIDSDLPSDYVELYRVTDILEAFQRVRWK